MINDQAFDQAINSDRPTVVMFWQRGCYLCERLVPILKEIAKQKSNLKFLMMNSHDNPKSKSKYGVKLCPTLVIFRNGAITGKHWIGFSSQDKITAWIDETVGA